MTSYAESVCGDVAASASDVISLCSWQCEVHDGTPGPDKSPSCSLARPLVLLRALFRLPSDHSLPSLLLLRPTLRLLLPLPSPSLVLRRRHCHRRLRVASNCSAVAAVSPPTATTVSLARSLARSVDVGSAATATVTVVEIIVGEREREGWRAAARGQRRPAFPLSVLEAVAPSPWRPPTPTRSEWCHERASGRRGKEEARRRRLRWARREGAGFVKEERGTRERLPARKGEKERERGREGERSKGNFDRSRLQSGLRPCPTAARR